MKVVNLRKRLKGIKGSADLSFGNYDAYSPKVFGDTLNIFCDGSCKDGFSIIHEERSFSNDKINKVVLWVEG